MFNHTFYKLRSTIQEARRFIVVGGICLAVGLLIQWFFFSVLGFHYLVGYGAAVLVTSVINWAMNRQWTFRSNDPERLLEAIRHQGVTLSMLAISTALFIFFVSGLGINYMVAHVSIAAFMLGVNFVLQRRFVYRKR